MRFALSKDGKNLEDVKIFPTPKSFDEALSLFSKYKDTPLKSAVGAIAGKFDKEKNVLNFSPNLQDWLGIPIKSRLKELFGINVLIENDAAFAGLGEAVKGAGQGFSIVAYLTISTGIGGVRIVDSKIDRNSLGFEPGQQIIDADYSVWPEAEIYKDNIQALGLNLGAFSTYASGAALGVRYSKKPEEIKDRKIWEEIRYLLEIGIYNTIVFWSPDIVVIGGGVSRSVYLDIDKIEKDLKKMLRIYKDPPRIKKSKLGDLSGLYGALTYLKQFES